MIQRVLDLPTHKNQLILISRRITDLPGKQIGKRV